MSSKIPPSRVDDDAPDDWLAEEGDVDWGGAEPSRGRREGGATRSFRAPASPADAEARLDLVRKRRAMLLVVLAGVVLLGIAIALIVVAGDDGEPTPTPATTATQPPAAPPPPATTQPPAATTPTLTVALPEDGQLAVGASGAEVEALQTALAALGFEPGEVDGQFGEATREAVRAFQTANDLAADGIVGSETVARLNAVLAEQGISASG